jgi:hypothetical protein
VRRLLSLMPTVRTLQYVLVAVVAFSLGGATVVQAVAPGGIMGVVQIADRTDTTRLAAVDAAGSVQVKVQAVSGTVNTGAQTDIVLDQVMTDGNRATVNVAGYKTLHVDFNLANGTCFGSGAQLIIVEATHFVARGFIGADAACTGGFTGTLLDTPGQSLTFIVSVPHAGDQWRVTVFARPN